MKTVQELIQAATTEALYQPKSFTQNNGIKNINEVRFGDVVANLDPDEDILFCLPYNFTSCVAFTNKRIIDAAKMTGFFQTNMTNTYSYESVNSVQGFVNYLVIKITGEADHMYAPLKGREQVAIAVKRINEAIAEYKKKSSAPATAVVVNNTSAADELKKFKELLDCGIISQEEFDAKKKQLLGL